MRPLRSSRSHPLALLVLGALHTGCVPSEARECTLDQRLDLDVGGADAPEAGDAGPALPCLSLPEPVVDVFEVDVPIDAQTLGEAPSFDGLELIWDELWRYTELTPRERARWSQPPPRDGGRCDAACLSAVLSLADARGGSLPATVTVTRLVRPRCLGVVGAQTCAIEVVEEVEIDTRTAVTDLARELEPYDFLVFRTWRTLEVAPVR